MKALYDSRADALQIDLEQVELVDEDVDVTGSCTVALAGGRVVGVELLAPAHRLGALAVAADRYDLDRQALEAAARAALAAPDRQVTVDVAAEVAA